MDADDVRLHQARSARDEALASSLGSSAGDWIVVLRFYAALHLVQSYLTTKHNRFDAKRHNERWSAIRASPELKQGFKTAYRRLQDVSEQVRYDPGFVARAHDLAGSHQDLTLVHSFLDSKITAYLVRVGTT